MWTKSVGRKELAEILQLERLSATQGLKETDRNLVALSSWDEVELIWKNNPAGVRSLPSAVLVEPDSERDLLAWIWTYVPSIRPLTAFSRVIGRQTAIQLLTTRRAPTLGSIEDASIGLILGETATYVGGRRELRDIIYTACLSTLSFVIGRAASLGISSTGLIRQLPLKWMNSRNLCRIGQLPLTEQQLERPWAVVSQLTGSEFGVPNWDPVDSVVMEACSSLSATGEIADREWRALTQDLGELVELRHQLTGPQEDRVIVLEYAVDMLKTRRNADAYKASFLCAFLANCISPGSLDHLHLLVPHLAAYPDVLLWYGLSAGLTSRGALLNSLNGLGRRLRRELLREDDLLNTPICDIAHSELAIMSASAKTWPDFRTANSGQVIVELLPCVNAYFRSGRSENGRGGRSEELSNALRDIGNHIAKAGDSLKRANRAAGITDERVDTSAKRSRRRS